MDGEIDVVVITFADHGRLDAYSNHLGIDFRVVSDPQRRSYAAYQLDRGALRKVYRWATLKAYVRLWRAGWRTRRSTDDTRQLGGDFVLDRRGVVRFAYRPEAPDDRPPAKSLVDAAAMKTAAADRADEAGR